MKIVIGRTPWSTFIAFVILAVSSIGRSATPTILDAIKFQDLHSSSEQLLVQALQGLLAAQGASEQIYVTDERDFGYPLWLDDLASYPGVSVSTFTDPWALVAKLQSSVAGYIVYDDSAADGTIPESFGVAASLAGILTGLPVSQKDEARLAAGGLRRLIDVRGKDERWLVENYRSRFADDALAIKSLSITGGLNDWVVANRLLLLSSGSSPAYLAAIGTFHDGAAAYGWIDEDEGMQVADLSSHGIRLVPANFAENMSVLTQFQPSALIAPSGSTPENGAARRFVAFVMSDGDNIQWLLGDFTHMPNAADPAPAMWYRDPMRGAFPFTWTVGADLSQVAPTAMHWLYAHASPNDAFISLNTAGYVFPELLPDVKAHAEAMGQLMQRSGMHYLVQMTRTPLSAPFDTARLCEPPLAQDGISGVILANYDDYAGWQGASRRVNGKLCTTIRYSLWAGNSLPGNFVDGPSLAQGLNQMPNDLSSPSAYAIVMVHAWSRTLNDVREAIARLDPDIGVVTVPELMQLMDRNLPLQVPRE